MTTRAPSEPAAGAARPEVWFPDTSALVTMAVHEPLQRAVVAALSLARKVLVQAIVDELETLAASADPAAAWADAALKQLDWLGKPTRFRDDKDLQRAYRLQVEIARGRALTYPEQHFGEAAIIALASQAQHLRPVILSDDYGARAAAKNYGIQALSIHKLLHSMIRAGKATAVQAASFAAALQQAGRAQDYTAAELASGRLGRVGEPTWP